AAFGRGPRRALHARGGGPCSHPLVFLTDACSPRTWRWSDLAVLQSGEPEVLSTHVEVVRVVRNSPIERRGCSPRTWRWSAVQAVGHARGYVLSTHVEVVRPL